MLRLMAILVMFAVAGTAAVVNRFAALLFYLWFAIFRPQEWLWIDISQYRPSLVIGAMVVVPSLLSRIWPNVTHPLSIGALVFLASAFIAQQNAVAPAQGWYWIDFLSKLIVISLFLATLASNRRRIFWVIAVIGGSFALHSAKAGLVSLLGGLSRFQGGLSGAFSDNNAYGIGSVMVLYLLAITAQNVRHRWLRYAWWVLVPLTVITVISTYSRAAFLGLAASALAFVLLQPRRRLLLASILAVVVAIGAVTLPSGYLDRVQTIRTYEEVDETSAISRLHFWQVALVMARNNPLGVGLWNFEPNFDRYDFLNGAYGTRMAVHNSALQVLTEAGWLGAAAWVFLLTWAFVTAFRVRRRARALLCGDMLVFVANGLICSTVAFVVGGFFSSMAYNDLTWLTFGIVTALDLVSRREAREAGGAPTEVRRPFGRRKPVEDVERTWRPPGR